MNNIVITLATLILEIQSNSSISNKADLITPENFQTSGDAIALMNAVFNIHRTKHRSSWDQAEQAAERLKFSDDIRLINSQLNPHLINEDAALLVFDLGLCENFTNVQYRSLCVSLVEQLNNIQCGSIKKHLAQRILNTIVNCGLYTSEPFISMIPTLIEVIETTQSEKELEYQIRFLE